MEPTEKSVKTGYDLGGGEYPYNPTFLTVVDILTPEASEQADYIRRDFNNSAWTEGLEPRCRVYLGKTLRYLHPVLSRMAEQVYSLVEPGGYITVFDSLDAIGPFMDRLLCYDGMAVKSFELINPAADYAVAEYEVVFKKAKWTIYDDAGNELEVVSSQEAATDCVILSDGYYAVEDETDNMLNWDSSGKEVVFQEYGKDFT
jgi:hypothetical protein